MNRLLKLLIIFHIAGCTQKVSPPEPNTIQVTEIPADFAIPRELIQIVEGDLAVESKILAPVFMFTTLKVQFTEKTPQTLHSPSILYRFPKGGGRIDLNSVVSSQGSFHISFPDEQFKELPPLEHLYYVSGAPKKNISGEEFGLGCARWIDLRNQFASMQKENFVNLNTTDKRHLFALAGTYVFVFRKINQIYLTHVSITDSKNEALLCPQIKAASL